MNPECQSGSCLWVIITSEARWNNGPVGPSLTKGGLPKSWIRRFRRRSNCKNGRHKYANQQAEYFQIALDMEISGTMTILTDELNPATTDVSRGE